MSVYTLKHASFYVKFRPKPAQEVINCITEFLGQKLPGKSWNLCLDVGCGSGQCTQLLSPHFRQVIGSDLYENQIAEARNNVNLANVQFVVSPAEKLQAADNTVDLVTCSQAMHWFNHDKFYPEVKRVLRPNGVLAATGYPNIPTIVVAGKDQAGKELTEHLRSTYQHKYITQYAIPKLKAIDNRYMDLDFPFEDFTRIEGINSFVETTVDELEGYVQAWSDFHRCAAAEPESANDVLELFRKSVEKTKENHCLKSDCPVTMTFNNFLIMGRKL